MPVLIDAGDLEDFLCIYMFIFSGKSNYCYNSFVDLFIMLLLQIYLPHYQSLFRHSNIAEMSMKDG